MIPLDRAKRFKVVRVELALNLIREPLFQAAQCVNSCHQRLAHVQDLGGELFEVSAAANLFGDARLELAIVAVGLAGGGAVVPAMPRPELNR